MFPIFQGFVQVLFDGVAFGMLLPGITVTITPTDYNTLANEQLVRFTGKSWERFGAVLSGL